MSDYEAGIYARREREEQERAAAATSVEVRDIHLDMARKYAKLKEDALAWSASQNRPAA